MSNNLSSTNTDQETFRTYYLLQFDRIDKLESKLESYSNLILTISAAILTFGYSTDYAQGNEVKNLVPLIVVSLNGFGILFALRTRDFIKMHQRRARLVLLKCAPEFSQINSMVPKPDSDNDFFRRNNLYIWIQSVFIFLAMIVLYNQETLSTSYSINILLSIKVIFSIIPPYHYSWISLF